MRCLVAAAVIFGISSMGSRAGAEPSPAPVAAPAPQAPAQFYLEFGAAAGVGIGLYAAAAGELGYRPGGGSLSIHAVIQVGSVPVYGPLDESVTSSGYLALRVGVEERGCERRGVWCAFASTDIGYLHQHAMTRSGHSDERVAIIVPRVGLDAGGSAVRVRVGVETSLARHNWETLGLAAGIAFNW